MKRSLTLLLSLVMVFSLSLFIYAEACVINTEDCIEAEENCIVAEENCIVAQKEINVLLFNITNKLDAAPKLIDVEFKDVTPQIINDRTMVPIRAVAEAVGYDVIWDAENQKVILKGLFSVATNGTEHSKVTNVRRYNQAKSIKNLFSKLKNSGFDNFNSLDYSYGADVEELLNNDYICVVIEMGIGQDFAKVNLLPYGGWYVHDEIPNIEKQARVSAQYNLDVPAQIVDNRTLLPLRAVGEMMGLEVEWVEGEYRNTVEMTAADWYRD